MRSASQIVGALVVLALGIVKIANGAILCKTNDGTLKVRDTACQKHEVRIDPTSLGLQGPPGPQGPRGPQGIQGAPGSPGGVPKLNAVIRSVTLNVQPEQGVQTLKVDCLPGEVAMGGSYVWANVIPPPTLHPAFDGIIWSWAVLVPNLSQPLPDFTFAPITVYTVCVSTEP